LVVFAGSLRFAKLGAWPFAPDEVATLSEADALFSSGASPREDIYRLPRIIPFSYLMLYVGRALFGADEFGTRVVPALFGTASVVIIFLGLRRPMGFATALATSLLVATWPSHLLQSQSNRFYGIAFFFSCLAVMLGWHAWMRRSPQWMGLACLAAFLAGLSHTFQFLMIGGLFAGILCASLVERRSIPWRLLAVAAGTGLVALLFAIVYLLPLARGWNAGESWGYSVPHGIIASVSSIGWPVLLLAPLGFVGLRRKGRGLLAYWSVFAGIWAVFLVVAPRYMTYHSGYAFPFEFAVIVLVGNSLGFLYELIRPHSVTLALASILAACLVSLPSTASYFQDGSRHDFRAAARFVRERYQPGDRVLCAAGLFHYYSAGDEPIVSLPAGDPARGMTRLANGPGRLWVVIVGGRNGLSEELRHWLGENASWQALFSKPRFDYYSYQTYVFLVDHNAR